MTVSARFLLLPHLGLGCLALLVFAGCGKPSPATVPVSGDPADELPLSASAAQNLELGFITAGPGTLRLPVRLQGEVVLDESRVTYVPARLAGVVEEIAVDLGDTVLPGTVLAALSSQDLGDRIMAYVETERNFRFAMQTLARERELREREISSEEQFLEVQQSYYQTENAHSQALQRLRVLGYEERELHHFMERPDLQDMTRYELRSPLEGIVLERDLQLGGSVEPGTNLFRVADLGQLWARFAVPLAYLERLSVGMPVALANETVGLEAAGEIKLIESQVDPRTRTVRVRASLPNREGLWRPGLPARVEVPGLEIPVACAVPRVAVQEIEGRPHVFVRPNEATVRSVPVKVGRQDETQVEILEGLETGQTVVGENSFLVLAAWENQAAE